jgi:acetyl-CoA carboxylase, biotin carboxylase subunit
MARQIDRVLVANRGEIALRAISAAQSLGVETVAVYSTADQTSPHVWAADQSICIGPPPSSKSYLDGEALLHVAKATNCQAIYPGYGFLSERADFARRCAEEGLVFIGPDAEVIRMMGDKAEARRTAGHLGLPLVPGSDWAFCDAKEAAEVAAGLGYPLMLKARGGGGGRGMRIARNAGTFGQLFEQAAREAHAAFGDGAIYLERFFEAVRHIEVQVFGDTHGTVRHLGERDCTVQRRHQKLIEEGPSPALSVGTRKKMCEAAEALAGGLNYVGAGTVEFIYEPSSETYCFIEMNTRIQVEHPVTEMLIGHDLVAEQLRVARGEELSVSIPASREPGHAVELRINAEEMAAGFRPSPGRVDRWRPPTGPGVRVDTFMHAGAQIPPFYDSMIGKLIVHGRSREEALDRARRALDRFDISGVPSTLDFHRAVLSDADFVSANIHTRWVEETLLPRLGSSCAHRDLF